MLSACGDPCSLINCSHAICIGSGSKQPHVVPVEVNEAIDTSNFIPNTLSGTISKESIEGSNSVEDNFITL